MAIGYDWTELNSYTVSISGFTGRFSLWVRLNSQDIANNKSNITMQWYLETQMGYAISYNSHDYVSGAGWNDSQRRTYQGNMVLREWTGDLTHNNDGTMSYTAYGRTEMVGIGVDTDWVAGYFELPTIARVSEPTVSPTNLSIINTSNTLTVITNRRADSLTHTITVSCGSWSSTQTGVGASTTFNIPYSAIDSFGVTGNTATLTTVCTTYSGSTNVGSKTVTSTLTLYRISSPTVSPSPLTVKNATNTLTVNTNRSTTSYTHTVKVTCGSWSLTNTGVGASTTFNVPYSVIAQFSATSKTATATVQCTTYNGSNSLGSKTVNVTFQIDTATDHPNVGTISISDSNTRTSSVVSSGQMIKGASNLVASIPLTVSGSYTQLASATVTCGTVTQTYTLSGTSQTVSFALNKVTVNSLTVTVTDKRGTTARKTQTWTLLDYNPLSLIGGVSRPSATGSTVVGTWSGICFGGTYGNTANSLTLQYYYKESGASTWISGGTYTQAISGSGQRTYTKTQTFNQSFNYTKQYDIRFKVSDLFTEYTYTTKLTQGLPIISWDESEVDIFGDLHIHHRDNPNVFWDFEDTVDGVLSQYGHKNLLMPRGVTETKSGVTCTANADGSVTLNGTSTADDYYIVNNGTTLPNGFPVTLTGCPSGGSVNTYRLNFYHYDGTNTEFDRGDGVTVTPIGTSSRNIAISWSTGVTFDNLTFYPMLRDARIVSSEYVPYQPLPSTLNTTLTNLANSTSMNVYSQTTNASSQTGDFNASFSKTVSGSGFLIFSVSCISDTYSSYGTSTCKIYLNGNVVAGSSNRFGSQTTWELGECAVACIAVTNGDTVRGTALITKNGTRKAYFSCLAIGCTLS